MNRTTTTEFNGYETLELGDQDGLLAIWLNRPVARNALSGEMMTELPDLFSTLRISTVIRALSLRGKGGIFCAGGGLMGFKALFQGEEPSAYNITKDILLAICTIDRAGVASLLEKSAPYWAAKPEPSEG